jgi:ubiquinone/menaquinone biosynthesis C-methylase UbiE
LQGFIKKQRNVFAGYFEREYKTNPMRKQGKREENNHSLDCCCGEGLFTLLIIVA